MSFWTYKKKCLPLFLCESTKICFTEATFINVIAQNWVFFLFLLINNRKIKPKSCNLPSGEMYSCFPAYTSVDIPISIIPCIRYNEERFSFHEIFRTSYKWRQRKWRNGHLHCPNSLIFKLYLIQSSRRTITISKTGYFIFHANYWNCN